MKQRIAFEEQECVFDHLLKYYMKILIGDFSAKVGREDIFILAVGNESFPEINNDSGVALLHQKI
jgi:hypothetical protein